MENTPIVVLDGELVVFEGTPPPVSAQSLAAVLMEALAEQGRVLTRFEVDGVNALLTGLPEDAPYTHVECNSLTQRAFLLEKAQNQDSNIKNITQIANSLSSRLLCEPWEVSIQAAQAFARTLAPYVDLLEACERFLALLGSPVANSIQKTLSKLEPLLDDYTHSIEASDAGSLAEQMLTAWAPWSMEAHALLTHQLLPELETEP